jgi:hypothetical protein
MSQVERTINNHIEINLDYYCNLSHAPGFAILLQGQWGCGKTWFINKYREKLKEINHKCLYVSLYGITNVSEIEEALFQQLHPVLSSKGMAITGRILKGILKGTLKIDLDNNGSDDGTVSIQIPEINLPDYLKNTDKCILIFDDLERCKIDLINLLGYINYFVEHQDLKVILVANEEVLRDVDEYQSIKEKLIGKTFGISLDFEGALENFISIVKYQNVRQFLSENSILIKDLYKAADYKNLRILKQVTLDFERIYIDLPEKAKNKPVLLLDLLRLLIVFSIEIKRGAILPKDINKLQEEYISRMVERSKSSQSSRSNEDNKESNSLRKMLERYPFLNPYELFPSTFWWENFLGNGILDVEEFNQSLLSSKYFLDENTPSWVILYHYNELSDDEFVEYLNIVKLEYSNRKYVELGEVRHVFGLFLRFSEFELIRETKREILENAKLYITYLQNNNHISHTPLFLSQGISDSYNRLGFQGRDIVEFTELSSFIHEIQELLKEENIRDTAQKLLLIMKADISKFYRMICLSNHQYGDVLPEQYYDVPLLMYIEPDSFVEEFLLLNNEHRRSVLSALSERYKFDQVNEKLIEELSWIKSIKSLLQEEVCRSKGKLSGVLLDLQAACYLNEVIEKLETMGTQSESEVIQ